MPRGEISPDADDFGCGRAGESASCAEFDNAAPGDCPSSGKRPSGPGPVTCSTRRSLATNSQTTCASQRGEHALDLVFQLLSDLICPHRFWRVSVAVPEHAAASAGLRRVDGRRSGSWIGRLPGVSASAPETTASPRRSSRDRVVGPGACSSSRATPVDPSPHLFRSSPARTARHGSDHASPSTDAHVAKR